MSDDDDAAQVIEDQVLVFSVADDDTLLTAVREVVDGTFGIVLHDVPGEALAVETDAGTLFVGVMSDFIVSLELRLPGEFEGTPPLLEYLNDRNAATTFVTFSVVDGSVWVSGNVDGHPFAPNHLVRVVDFMFQAAAIVTADLEAQG
jgi:hypothetical protein